MSFKTITADRPEVVAGVKDKIFAPLTGYIGARLLPLIPKRDKTGNLYYKTLDADSAAETRANSIAAITRQLISNANKAYAVGEAVKAYQIPEDDVKNYGSIEAADRIGVAASCRSVVRAHEKAVADLFLTSGNYNAAEVVNDVNILVKLQEKAYLVGRYYGRTVLVAGLNWFQKFALSSAVSAKLTAIIGNAFNREMFEAAVAGNTPVALNMMRALLPFDEMLIGDDAFWGKEGYEDFAFVTKVAPANVAADPELFEEVLRENPVLGATPWYLPDPAAQDILFTARSYFDEDNDCNVYKAKGLFDVELLNNAFQAIKFTPVALSTTTTSTTTTTTSTTTTTTTTTTTSDE
jgi:hypothetical protein